jgi:hypothetical protein
VRYSTQEPNARSYGVTMTSERSQAYGRVADTLTEIGPTKLLPREQERLRDAADTLLFCEDPRDESAVAARHDVSALIDHLVTSGRWTEARAARLADDLAACGPVPALH